MLVHFDIDLSHTTTFTFIFVHSLKWLVSPAPVLGYRLLGHHGRLSAFCLRPLGASACLELLHVLLTAPIIIICIRVLSLRIARTRLWIGLPMILATPGVSSPKIVPRAVKAEVCPYIARGEIALHKIARFAFLRDLAFVTTIAFGTLMLRLRVRCGLCSSSLLPLGLRCWEN